MCPAVVGVVVRQENVNAKHQIFCAIRDVTPLAASMISFFLNLLKKQHWKCSIFMKESSV
jgi:hypothetical protein